MKISLSRRFIEKTIRHGNANRFRGMSTASDISRSEMHREYGHFSGMLSFASPESDFVSASKMENVREYATGRSRATWSESLSFASPESDFVSAPKTVHTATISKENQWSESLSFASPESDFVSAPEAVHMATTPKENQWSESLSFASPESDFVSAPETVHAATSIDGRSTNIESVIQDLFQTHHLHHSPETATGVVSYSEMLDDTTLETLLKKKSFEEILPKTMKEALNDERPIVITSAESPFCIVDVNDAWERLCGFRREEAIGKNVASLLQGPETNMESAQKLVRSLQENGFSETTITNYAKDGRSFDNHIQIGMMPVDDSSISSSSNDFYFVGLLHDVSRHTDQKVAAM